MRSTVSTASEPPEVKNTWFMCAGATSEMAAASSAAPGWVVLKKVL